MKVGMKLLSLLMAAAMSIPLAALSSCNSDKLPEPRDVEFTVSAERQAAMDTESDTIRVLFPGLDKNVDEWRNRAVARFQEKFNKKVEYIPATFSVKENTEKIYASIAAQNPYDAVWGANSDFPLFYVRQYTQSIGDYVDMEMLEENNWVNINIMEQFGKYNGEYYLVVPYNFVNPFYVFYNKDMITELGMEDPKELYENDKWTVEEFHNMAYAATRDVDGDGVNDTIGITTNYTNVWDNMNHTAMVTTDTNGKYILNLDNPAQLRAFDYYRDIMFDKTGTFDNKGSGVPQTTFAKGQHLFMIEPYWAIWEMYQNSDTPPSFEWDMVPLPYGADNTDKYNAVSCGGMSFINGCPNPYTTATLIEMICQEDMYEQQDREANATYGQYITEERKLMRQEMTEKAFYAESYDALLTNYGRDLLQAIGGGSDNASAIEKWRATYESDIQRINASVEWPDIVNHDPYTFDFDSNIDGWEVGPTVKGASVSQATGTDALDGNGSLKIEFDTEANGNTLVLATLTEQYRLYGYTTYKISFDYKVVGDMTEETEYFLAYYNIEAKKQKDAVYFTPEASPNDEVRHAEVMLEPVSDNETVFTMLFGSRKAPGTIIIDNVTIEQVRSN